MTCPSCGYKEAGGNFCASCGSALGAQTCRSCGATPPAGSHFCPKCGSGLAAGAAAPRAVPPPVGPPLASGPGAGPPARGGPGSNVLAWVIGALMVVGGILIVVIPRLNAGSVPSAPASAPFAGAGGLGSASSVDLSSMTPREAADRLWNRVVAAAEAGDSVEARTFVPMGIAAYQRVGELDADGLYHLSVLQRIGGDFEGAIASAEQVLATNPSHLLALSAAGEAAWEAGDRARSVAYFQRLVDGFEAEQARALPEYAPEAHGPLLPSLLEGAQGAIAGTR